MKKSYSYQDCYHILGLDLNSDWTTLRRTYKKLIQKWHPDRFADGTKEKLAAEGKIKTINIAYKQIHAFYRKKNTLPLARLEPELNSDTTSSFTDSPVKKQKVTETPIKRSTQSKPKTKPEVNKRTRFSIRMGVSTIVVLGSFYYYATESFHPEKPQIINNTQILPTSQHINTQHLTSKKHLSDSLTFDKKIPASNEIQEAADTSLKIKNTYFTNGSSISDVINIQGAPTKTEGDTWFYGDSEVHFIEGKVTYWIRKPQNPLKARMTINTSKTTK